MSPASEEWDRLRQVAPTCFSVHELLREIDMSVKKINCGDCTRHWETYKATHSTSGSPSDYLENYKADVDANAQAKKDQKNQMNQKNQKNQKEKRKNSKKMNAEGQGRFRLWLQRMRVKRQQKRRPAILPKAEECTDMCQATPVHRV